MRFLFVFSLFLLSCNNFFGQITGKITDANNNPIPFATIIIEKTYVGTSSNEDGKYQLPYQKTGDVVIIYQSIGYKSKRLSVNIQEFPLVKDVQLESEEYSIESVVVKNDKNLGLEIIKKAIAKRKTNEEKTNNFEADFYSRGTFRVKNMPKKIMGFEIGDLEGNLDSKGNGIIYQSETVSKIKFQRPNKINEEIIASKIAGNDNGFSFNTALNTDFNFYGNSIDLNIPVVSPIASNATLYYKYKFEGFFYDEYKNHINKIKVIAKRDNEPSFDGYIYIVEDTWAIYALDLETKGKRVNNQFMDKFRLVQNFNYNPDTKIWAKNNQIIEFNAGAFGINFEGKFNHVFTNYKFIEKFEKKSFSNEVVKFAENANKKDDDFWTKNRQVPLQEEEKQNYISKDSIYKVRNSDKYLDSIDKVKNKFKVFDIITGYDFQNSKRKYTLNYSGLFSFDNINFNTVQGWNINTDLSFVKRDPDIESFTEIKAVFDYGLSDKRFRPTMSFFYQFNRKNRLSIYGAFGNRLNQFNPNVISKSVNTIATQFFKDNYMKVFDETFINIGSSSEIFNGVRANLSIEYSDRKNAYNTNFTTFIKNNDPYLSNNPLMPNVENSNAFINHSLVKLNLSGRIFFNQKYISRPNGKVRVRGNKYPVLNYNYKKGFLSSISDYNFDFLSLEVNYDVKLGVQGELKMNFGSGSFLGASDKISFIDYKHFDGNQTHYLDKSFASFALLPYYTHSTNKSYLESHIMYDDNGYIFNKIPLLNKLQYNLLFNYHLLSNKSSKPYQEFSVGINKIGFGKFKIFRVDYVRAYQNGYLGDGFMFGINF